MELTPLEVKSQASQYLLSIPGVSGVGLSKASAEKINIYVIEKTPEIMARLPDTVNGMETRIIETGEIKALQYLALAPDRTMKARPAFPGQSIGHVGTTAGTFSFVGRDNFTGRRVIVSNAHVLTPDPTVATMSDTSVVQPGIYDGGTFADKIGDTIRWTQIFPDTPNLVDCAIALPLNDAYITDEILEIGKVRGVAMASVGMGVKKSGRSSGLNFGNVIDIHADIKVGYKDFEATFTDQVLTTAMGVGGDSGSLTLDTGNNAVGLLFAGSDRITCHNKIHNVLSRMNISVSGAGYAQAGSLILLPVLIGGAYMMLRGKL